MPIAACITAQVMAVFEGDGRTFPRGVVAERERASVTTDASVAVPDDRGLSLVLDASDCCELSIRVRSGVVGIVDEVAGRRPSGGSLLPALAFPFVHTPRSLHFPAFASGTAPRGVYIA